MSDEVDEIAGSKFIPFSKRPEFADVKPIPQNDGESPVCPIAYSPEYVEVMDYFRAMLFNDERTPRSLEVITKAIDLNAANYTAWIFRRAILTSIPADLREELNYITDFGIQTPKNYQIWFHRKAIVELLDDSSEELAFTATVLKEDAKNYHAWTHRQWVIKEYNLWKGELEYVESLISSDVRNNSAWNQRYFVVHHTTGFTDEIIQREVTYCKNMIQLAPSNESSWNYFNGLVRGKKYSDIPAMKEFCESKLEKWPHCANLLSTLVEIYEEEQQFDKAYALCDQLQKGVDDIHKKYWIYRRDKFKQ